MLTPAKNGFLIYKEKMEDFTINEYFIKIRDGYTPWKMEIKKKIKTI